MRNLIIGAVTLLVCGCDPYRFTMMSNEALNCRIYSEPQTVVVRQNYFDMTQGSVVSISSADATQFRIVLPLRLLEGEGIDLLLRPRIEEAILDSGIVLSLSVNGTILRSRNEILSVSANPSFTSDKTALVSVFNDDKLLRIIVNCDTLHAYPLTVNAPDKIGLCLHSAGIVRVFAPDWYDLERN